MNFLNSKKGFTLIELLVVVAIIALLSTIVLSSLNDAKEKSKWTAFNSEILEIQKGVQLYKEDNSGNWPAIMNNGSVDAVDQIVSFLNSEGHLSLDSIEYPITGSWRFGPGYLTNKNSYFSCGGVHRDVYYVLYHAAPTTTSSILQSDYNRLFKQLYLNTNSFATGRYSCFEFR